MAASPPRLSVPIPQRSEPARRLGTKPQAEWHSILRGTLYPLRHERSLSNRLRTWPHPRRISFLRAYCISAFYFFSSHLEITLLFCLRYFCHCTAHAFELQWFWVLHRAGYRSWCANGHEPIQGNWGTRGSDCHSRFTRFIHSRNQLLRPYNHPHQQVGNPQEKPRGETKSSSSTTLVVRQIRRNKSVLLFQLRSELLFHVSDAFPFDFSFSFR